MKASTVVVALALVALAAVVAARSPAVKVGVDNVDEEGAVKALVVTWCTTEVYEYDEEGEGEKVIAGTLPVEGEAQLGTERLGGQGRTFGYIRRLIERLEQLLASIDKLRNELLNCEDKTTTPSPTQTQQSL